MLVFRPPVVEQGAAGVAEQRGELCPGIRRAHIDDTDRPDPRARRLGINEVGCFAGLHAPPERLFGRDQNAKIKWVEGNRDLYPFAAAGDD